MPDPTDSSVAVADEKITFSTKTSSASKPYIGQWNQLISTTNWEKGEIITQWRESLKDENVPAAQFTDEAWSQLVGGVTPQHVGRLRRTHERFGHVYKEYEGIYWSHFYASLDWDDAEMWLEGAVQNKWSVSGMRQQRWETLGKIGDAPTDSEIVSSEVAEETQSLSLSENTRDNDRDYIEGPVHEGPDWGDENPSTKKSSNDTDGDEDKENAPKNTGPKVRPFESFKDLPDDVMDAANSFKVAIIRHKADEWSEVSQDDMIGMLDALKQLMVASSE